MSNKLFDKVRGFVLSPGVKSFFEYLRRVMLNRWPLKLACLLSVKPGLSTRVLRLSAPGLMPTRAGAIATPL